MNTNQEAVTVPNAEFKDLDEITKAVDAQGNVLTTHAGAIRDAFGHERLGKHVRASISRELESQGLGHFPPVLPDRQWEPVRIYRRGTEVAELIEAVLKPGSKSDDVIRAKAAGDEGDVLNRIRALVCE